MRTQSNVKYWSNLGSRAFALGMRLEDALTNSDMVNSWITTGYEKNANRSIRSAKSALKQSQERAAAL